MKKILVLLLLVSPILGYSQSVTLKLLPKSKVIYESIIMLSEGNTDWLEEPIDEVEGIAYRVIMTREDIYNRIFIEKITYGMEGCCKSIIYKKEVSLEELYKMFNLKGEIAGVEFRDWVNDKSFDLRINNKIFTITIIDDTIVEVNLKVRK
jgi:hypothetical protein